MSFVENAPGRLLPRFYWIVVGEDRSGPFMTREAALKIANKLPQGVKFRIEGHDQR